MKKRITHQLTYREAESLRDETLLAVGYFRQSAIHSKNDCEMLVSAVLNDFAENLVLRTVYVADVQVSVKYFTAIALQTAINRGLLDGITARTVATAICAKFNKQPKKKAKNKKRILSRYY